MWFNSTDQQNSLKYWKKSDLNGQIFKFKKSDFFSFFKKSPTIVGTKQWAMEGILGGLLQKPTYIKIFPTFPLDLEGNFCILYVECLRICFISIYS